MSVHNIKDADDLVECPYDKLHMIRVKRFPYHVNKCAKNHPDIILEICPFNARHRVAPSEIRHHKANCVDRVLIEQDMMIAQEHAEKMQQDNDASSVVTSSNTGIYDEDENWDTPTQVATGGDHRNGLRDLSGMTAAQKKEYYQLTKENLKRRREGLPPLDSLDSMATSMGSPLPSEVRLPVERPRLPGSSRASSRLTARSQSSFSDFATNSRSNSTAPFSNAPSSIGSGTPISLGSGMAGVGRGAPLPTEFSDTSHNMSTMSIGSTPSLSRSLGSSIGIGRGSVGRGSGITMPTPMAVGRGATPPIGRGSLGVGRGH